MKSDSLRAMSATMRPTPVLSPISGMDWVESSACQPKPGEAWDWREFDLMFHPFKPDSDGARKAQAICATCPVIRECATAALEHNLGGVVAGVVVPERNGSNYTATGIEQARKQLAVAAGVAPAVDVITPRSRTRAEIHRMHQKGMPVQEIARHMGLTERSVQRHLEDAPSRQGRRVLSMETVRQIRAARADGSSYKALAERFGVSKGSVAQIVTGRSYRETEVAS